MIVSVYGIPRAGKDTFIKKITCLKPNSFHLKGSETLDKLSNQMFGCSFKSLDENKQNVIRIEFTKYAKTLELKYSLVLVDGHFAFPKGNKFISVFTSEDLKLYDAFFYLKSEFFEILRNFNSDNKKGYESYLLDETKVNNWIDFEIETMKEIVENKDKDFIVLDTSDSAIKFVCDFLITSNDKASLIAEEIAKRYSGKKIILSDLDKTISINDLTNDFIKRAGLDDTKPKVIFKGDYYTSFQFYLFHNWIFSTTNYEEAIRYALDRIELNYDLIENVRNLKKDTVVIGLTTGIADAWDIKNKEIKLFDEIYGYKKDKNLIITPLIKKIVAKKVSSLFKTIGIGDSIIDLGMLLECNKGYLISMVKLDKRIVQKFIKGTDFTSIKQPSYSNYKYDFIKEGDLIW